jgi:hypothetical protein
MPDYPAIETVPEVTSSLTSVERVKEFIQSDEVDDLLISNLIAAVSSEIEGYLGHTINSATVTDERLDSIGAQAIHTRHYPIISISSLDENETALVADTDYELKEWDKASGRIVRISGGYPVGWASGAGVVVITYVHGYADVPYAIVQAATELVVFDYRQSVPGGGRFGLDGKVTDSGGTSGYLTREQIWEAQKPRLSAYRRRWM